MPFKVVVPVFKGRDEETSFYKKYQRWSVCAVWAAKPKVKNALWREVQSFKLGLSSPWRETVEIIRQPTHELVDVFAMAKELGTPWLAEHENAVALAAWPR
jgi:hypothetical protein